MKIIAVKDYEEMSQKAAGFIIERVSEESKLVLGLATGGTPIGTYQCMVKDHQTNHTSYQHVVTFNLDEYIGMKPEDPNSYHYYMAEHLFDHIDIPKEQIHLPDGQAEDLAGECKAYDQKIEEHGGIDMQILGLGSNGHIGFNEPGTPFDTATHVIDLTEDTREANARFFNSLDEVPTQAITMGIKSIMKSRKILLLVSGEEKSEALARFLDGEADPSFPASVLKKHDDVIVIADAGALRETDIAAYSDEK